LSLPGYRKLTAIQEVASPYGDVPSTTLAETTTMQTTLVSVTDSPTTEVPVTDAPTTTARATTAPTTVIPTTHASTIVPPDTVAPTTDARTQFVTSTAPIGDSTTITTTLDFMWDTTFVAPDFEDVDEESVAARRESLCHVVTVLVIVGYLCRGLRK